MLGYQRQIHPSSSWANRTQLEAIEKVCGLKRGGAGLIEEERWDEGSRSLIVRRTQDLDPFLDYCRERQVHEGKDAGKSPSGEWYHAATVPNWLVLKWKKENGVDVFNPAHTKAMLRLLNDPEYRGLRIWGGRL